MCVDELRWTEIGSDHCLYKGKMTHRMRCCSTVEAAGGGCITEAHVSVCLTVW